MKNKSQSNGTVHFRQRKGKKCFAVVHIFDANEEEKLEKRSKSKSIREDVKNLCFTMMKTDPMTPIDCLRNDDSIVCHFSSFFV